MRDPSGLAAEGDEQLGLLPARRDAAVQKQVHVRWNVKTGGGVGCRKSVRGSRRLPRVFVQQAA
jgi:hypothetical protein